MHKLFEKTSSIWVRYDSYVWKAAQDGGLYLTPAPGAAPRIYDPLENAQSLVVDALNIGRLCMRRMPDSDIQKAMLAFAEKYGLMGLMTALPTTPSFMDYEAVYLPKNHFIRAETMQTDDYLRLFFPFQKLDVVKQGIESMWNISGDRTMMALAMTMADRPTAMNMSFQREYAEPYEWLKTLFTDWIFTFSTSLLYYEDYDFIDEDTRNLYRQSMAAFEGIAPSYHIALLDKPTIVWDFHSLLLGIQMMFSFMLTDKTNPLRLCKNCTNVFVARRSNAQFCCTACRDRYRALKEQE